MKRDHFLKTIAALTGGLTVVGCNPDLLDEIVVADEALKDLSIEEAEKWFNDSYLPVTSTLRMAGDSKSHRRKATWGKAQKPKNAKNKEYGWVWVPIDYEGAGRPGVILYNDETKYRLELSKYFIQPIIEGLIVIKKGKETTAFLAQIAYDPFELAANDYKLEKKNFTGTLLKADWNDKLIDGFAYEKGKLIKAFANPTSDALKNARTESCDYYSINYSTWSVANGVVTIHGHTAWASVCTESGGGGWGGGGSGGGGGGGGTTVTNGGTGGGAYYDPLVGSGNGGWVIPYTYNFNINTASTNPNSTDRAHINHNLGNALTGVGLGTSLAGWSIDKASALARSIGGTVSHFSPLAMRMGTTFGAVGVATTIGTVGMAVYNGTFEWDDEGWDLAAAALGITALAFGGTWIAVATGAVSIAIAIGTAN